MTESQMTDQAVLHREGLAAQLYKINNPHGPLWHVLREDLRRRWRNKADEHLTAILTPEQHYGGRVGNG